MASVGIRKRVSARTGRVTYQVWWLLDDGSQGAQTVSSKDEARDLVAQKRLGVTRGAWQGLQRGRLPFSWWAEQWWEVWAADPDRSPTTLAVTESRLRLYVRPWFGERPIERIGPADIRRWQAQLAGSTGQATLMQCRSLVLRILQFAVDEGALEANPVRKVPSPRRRADPEQVLDQVKRRALTPEEAGRLLAQFPLFWWDHVLCLLGTGLRFGELAGLRRRRVHLDRPLPVLQVVDTRYQAGRFGSGFKPRPKSDAGIRELPWPRWSSRPSVARCHRAPTRRPWCSPALAAAQAATAGPGCPRALGPCCRATTSTAPTTRRWPSSPTPLASCGPPPLACSRRSELAARTALTGSPPRSPATAGPSGQPRSRSPWASWWLRAWSPRSVRRLSTDGWHCHRPAIPC
jgi:integrase-like protein